MSRFENLDKKIKFFEIFFQNYMVYWTDNPGARLSEWQKVTVYGRRVVFPELKYDWFYLFCANACFKDGQRSPLSRALFIKTDKLQFNSCCGFITQFSRAKDSSENLVWG